MKKIEKLEELQFKNGAKPEGRDFVLAEDVLKTFNILISKINELVKQQNEIVTERELLERDKLDLKIKTHKLG